MKSPFEKILSDPRISSMLKKFSSIERNNLELEDIGGKKLFTGKEDVVGNRHPITASDQTIGWVTGNASCELLADFLSHAASWFFEKKELAAETLDKYREITLFYDVSEKIASCLEPTEAARLVISEAMNLIQSSSASVMLYDEEAACLKEIAASGEEDPSSASITPGDGIVGRVYQKGQSEIVNNSDYASGSVGGKNKCRSVMCVPLRIKDRVIGTIKLSAGEAYEYNAANLMLLSALAAQAAVIIENGRLYSEMKLLRDAAVEENEEIRNYTSSKFSFQSIVTSSPAMREALRLAEKVAKKDFATVAIFGENGTGKEVLAKAIHASSGLLENRFAAVNCAAIPSHLLESELFGHVKGAFTGADRDRPGKFDAAQNGTLLLDEIGDMPLDLQAKLLRVLQERCYQRVGSNNDVKTDFRVIATTHRELKALVREGKFREDLYHRLCMFPITIPPLRERKDDIPLLIDRFMTQFQAELGKPLPGLSKAAMKELMVYDWPGNVRELRNCIERATILADGDLIGPSELGLSRGEKAGYAGGDVRLEISLSSHEFSLEAAVNQILQIALERCNGNKTDAAKLLKVDRKLFYRRINTDSVRSGHLN